MTVNLQRRATPSGALVMPNGLTLDHPANSYHRRIQTAYAQAGLLTPCGDAAARGIVRSDSAYELAPAAKHARDAGATTPALPAAVRHQLALLQRAPRDRRAQHFPAFWVAVRGGCDQPMGAALQRQVLGLAIARGLLPAPGAYVAPGPIPHPARCAHVPPGGGPAAGPPRAAPAPLSGRVAVPPAGGEKSIHTRLASW